MKLVTLIAILLLGVQNNVRSSGTENDFNAFELQKERWVESVYNALTINERIAQLFIIRAYSNRNERYNDRMTDLIRRYNVGGVCFFQGTPSAQVELTNRWQQAVKIPLIVAIDAEWGLGMRLNGAYNFPFLMTLGACGDNMLVYEMASAIARDCKRMGIHMNLAPVVDVNNNPNNPVINFRSFGENPYKVARKGVMYVNGLQDHGVVATAKHFPGHGDTDSDSHLTLPLVNHSKYRMEAIELFPFQEVINNGVKGIMIAHLYVPSYDNTPNLPTTLSPRIVNELLKNDMRFQGFVITDALDMSGVTRYYSPGEIEVKALLAGNDILLLPQDISTAITAIRRAVDKSIIPIELIERKCKEILRLKFDLGLDLVAPIDRNNLSRELNPISSNVITNKIYKSAVTLVKNDNNLIPLTQLQHHKIASVSIGTTTQTPFQKRLDWHAPITCFQVSKQASSSQLFQLRKKLKAYDLVILGIHNNNLYPANSFGIPDKVFNFINKLSQNQRTILAIFGNPYILNSLKSTSSPGAILVTYQDQPEAEEVAAEVIVGGIGSRGHLPVTTTSFPAGTGIETDKIRLEFVIPEEIGVSSKELESIDSLAIEGITSEAYPGCQVLFAKEGKVFYNKAFGHPRYNDPTLVRPSDIYDIASLTKVAATTLAVMKLYEQGAIHPGHQLSHYLPELRGTNKEEITIREMMAHQAGLEPWIPFYIMTLKDSLYPDPEIYSPVKSSRFPIRVSNDLYIKQTYYDSIFNWIIQSELRPDKEYKYSDLGFYLLMKLVERTTNLPFQIYLEENFYRPLGLTTLGFHPRERFPLSRIIPTEYDTSFRQQVVHGDVHDPGAAMLGGVSGHAGLFSDAFDLAVIFQMLLNDGQYGGKQYLLPSTIQEFTRIQFPEDENRRGMAFDKPLLEYEPDGPTCEAASPVSFGHSGFTGVYVWADPANELVYVFLSNRVFPDAMNSKISEMNIRTKIHQQMYEVLKK